MPCKALRLVTADQLSRNVAALSDIDPETDIVVMGELSDEASYVRHHKKKIAFLFSAMRHFAKALEDEGIRVDYHRLDDGECASFTTLLKKAVRARQPDKIICTFPGEYRVLQEFEALEDETGITVEIRPDDRFLSTPEEFADWADGRKSLRMEYFYREMRKKTGLLMDNDGKPEGGEWNFDGENRKALPNNIKIPEPMWHRPDDITKEVIRLVESRFDNHFGDLEPMRFAVTRDEALAGFRRWVDEALPNFGDYQDAMATGEKWLFHSVISPALNAGLLDPLEVCRAAEKAYREGHAPLNAVEGFIRQIIGWREFVRGLYWLKMPGYKRLNHFRADRALPDFFWTGDTEMHCMAQAITQTKEEAWAHHIQRLMVTGNFSLIAGLAPDAVNEWYMVVYADAYEWVELPNVHGMVLFADGGLLASKPYAASGKYIDRMSNYCKSCVYNVKKNEGEDACPLNYLYWDFIARHHDTLKDNPRMGMIVRTFERMKPEKIDAMRKQASEFLGDMDNEPGKRLAREGRLV